MSMQITITGSTRIYGDGHTAYMLLVQQGSKQWTIRKRYREFLELDNNLQQVNGISRAPLPAKGTFGIRKSITSSFMESRQQGLQEYLSHLAVQIQDVDDVPALATFLGSPPDSPEKDAPSQAAPEQTAPQQASEPAAAQTNEAPPTNGQADEDPSLEHGSETAEYLGVKSLDQGPETMKEAFDASVIAAFEAQKALFATGATHSVGWRCEQIKKLCIAVQQNAQRISAAQLADGVTPSDFTGSAGMLMGAMGYYLSKVAEWSAPVVLEDTLPPERAGGIDCDWLQVKEPKGLVLNIAPWNAPVLLSVLPVLGALAAGNCCVIKPPDSCPQTSALLKEIVEANLAPEVLTVVEGGADVVNGLIDLGFDHIMFTGGTAIGKLIMGRAATNLTPVTLELGGKNPVLIDDMDDEFMGAVIKELVGTKVYFAGEFCQCHDYLLVVDSMWDKFTDALGKALEALGDKRYVRIIHEKHYNRVKKMMTDHQGTCMPSAPLPDDAALKLPVTAILEPKSEDFVMQDEVFGPCWPIMKVSSVSDAIARVASMPTGKPLVSYYYGQQRENSEMWMKSTSSGSLAINSGPMRMQSNFNAAIHGVGNSGLGGASIWGKHVFDTFSHKKHVVRPRGDAFAGSIWGAGPYLGKAAADSSSSDSPGKGKGKGGDGYPENGGTGKGSGKAQALGAVQQAFGAAEKGYEQAWDAMAQTAEFKAEFGDLVGKMSPMEQKLLSIRTLLPVARAKVQSEPEVYTQKRKGILAGYRGKAAGKGIPWKESMENLQSRGLETWEREREACTDPTLVYPSYWEQGGKGTLHSYDAGNCNWEAAFDLPCGAYELVHAHHFPDVPAQDCFAKLHQALDNATIDALDGGQALVAVDVGCGAGTSSFSLRETLNERGFDSCKLTALDLSTYFVAVARYRLAEGDKQALSTDGKLEFKHGNALDTRWHFGDGEVDIFMASALTHEMPKAGSEQLISEVARALRPGGVFGYFDLNPVQILRDNPVSNIVDRVAISNEPFLDEFLQFDIEATLKSNGLQLVEIRSTNTEKWPNWQDCPARIVIAKKPAGSTE